MLSAAERFRAELRRIVRRASRDPRHEGSMDEFTSHFDDLYTEAMAAGKSEVEADKQARQRLGSLFAIAFQIVNSPERTRTGLRIQLGALATFALAIASYLIITFFIVQVQQTGQLFLAMQVVQIIYVGAGIVFGIGIWYARKVAWKPILLVMVGTLTFGTIVIDRDSQPEHLFQMSRKEVITLVAKQRQIEPAVQDAEVQFRNVQLSAKASPDLLRTESRTLEAKIKRLNGRFMTVSGGTGPYLYPTKIDYPQDRTFFYTVTLARTADLATAQEGWVGSIALAEQVRSATHARSDNFEAFRRFSTSKPYPWTLALNLGAILAIGGMGAFLMLSLGGYLLCRIWVLRLDWFRLSRI